MERYPYFVYPLICRLRETEDPREAERLRELIAVNVGDRDALMALIGDVDLRRFYPDQSPSRLSTSDTIDSFIEKFGGGGQEEAVTSLFSAPEEKPAEPEEQPEAVREEEDSRAEEEPEIVAGQKRMVEEEHRRREEEENPLMKVKILVKNREYGAALEIMEEYYLNNPKKSVYFADQIRFIRKMMLNESKK